MQELLIFCVLKTLHDYIIPGNNWRPCKKTWILCHFNVTIPVKLILFLIVTVSSYVLVQALDTVCLFFIIYITLLEYLLTKFLDEIKVWCHRPVAFKGSWLLNMPDCIIIFFLLEFRFVCLHLISNAHMADLAPCLCIYFDIPVLKEGYEALRINSTTNNFISALSNCF